MHVGIDEKGTKRTTKDKVNITSNNGTKIIHYTNIFCWVCFFIVVLTLGIQSVSCVFAVHSLTGPGPGGLIFERLGFSWGS